MKPVKSVFLKTYGKQRRKLSCWISPDNRKQVFDSSLSTDGDLSEFEPSKPGKRAKRPSVASRNGTRPAKKKAMWSLTEDNSCEEDGAIPSLPLPHPQQSRTTRLKRTRVCNSRAVRPAKRKAVLRGMQDNSDEENISCSLPAVAQQSNRTRRNQLASNLGVLMKRKGQQVPVTSESEGDSTSVAKSHKNSVQKKSGSDVQRSVGRFVTCRSRRAAARPTLPKAAVSILNSSDDFATGALRSRRTLRPTRRMRVPPSAFLVSSAENSINTVGTLSFANPLREISLNESADHSLGLYSRNPPFCSTPSASSFSTRPRLKPFSINEKSPSTPSMAVGCAGILSPFQENLKSPTHPVSPPLSPPPTGLHSDGKLQPSLCEQSGDLFMDYRSTNKRRSCSEEANGHTEESKTKFTGELSVNLPSVDSESSSDFVSAAGELEWQIEALKEKCLTISCTVPLQRLENLTVTQFSCQTTYSSCLGLSSLGHSQQTHEPPQSVDGSQTSSNLHSLKTRSCSRSVNSCDSLGQAASGTDLSSLVDCGNFADESTHHKESSVDLIMGTQLSAKSVETLFTEDEAVAVNDKRLVKKCTVQLKRLDLSQLTVQQLKGFTNQKETHSACSRRSVNAENDHTRNTNDPEDLACLGETTEGSILSVRRSVSTYGPVAQTQSRDPATEEKAAHTTTLKERFHSRELSVEIKRISLPQSKGDRGQMPPTDASGPASHEQIHINQQSDSDLNVCHQDTSLKVNRKKRSLTCSEVSSSSSEEVVKSSCDILPKRKKMSLVPKEKKRRSTSTDRPGTTRKACVSGLSVNRWKNKSNTSAWLRAGEVKSVDCSINELITAKHQRPKELGGFVNLSTPVRASALNISSLLADFTPNTHTWRRLKAALSVHRKVLLTPSSVHHQGTPRRTALTDISQDLFSSPLRSLLPKHLQLQLTCDSLVCEDAELSDAEKVYAECGQEQPLAWEECILPHRMKRCVKIGEGTFGEVFSTTNASGETVALKIIPLEGSEKVNGEDQKTFGEILHEIIISKELSSLKEKQHNQTHSFIGLNDLHCVRGRYPPEFLSAWDKFDHKKGSENDRPDFFEEDQFFLILEFEFGGADLENSNGTLASLGVAKSILHQVTAALAVAEQELHFEHRDLHWGNVLVKATKQKTGSFLLNGTTHSVETKGLLVRIIDYSLSRLEIDDLTVSCDISKDEELFMGQGDYQFDIYRLMRQENGNEWSVYRPHTNVLWLHYLCSKLLSMKYRGSGGRGAKDTREELTHFYDSVLQYGSATEALQNCPMFQ